MQKHQKTSEDLWFLNTLVQVRVSHEQGADGLSVIENRAPFGDSPPIHIHHTEDELFVILAGQFRFVAGGEERLAGPGDTVLTPKGVPHTYRVESPDGGRWLVVTTRGDFEGFVRELSREAATAGLPPAGGPPRPEEIEALGAVANRHHIELVGPPLV